MSAKEKKHVEDSPVASMRAAYAAGEVRSARTQALAIENDAGASDAARAAAVRLRSLTDVDPRAITIGVGAVVLAAVFIGFFLF